jgi:aspartate carbamoyltransferase catalytic subunit
MDKRHVLSIKDFSKKEIFDEIIPGCQEIIRDVEMKMVKKYKDPIDLVIYCGEPGSRTGNSYKRAGDHFGFNVNMIVNPQLTSQAKNESWAETVRAWANQGTNIVAMRTKIEGPPRFLAKLFETEQFVHKIPMRDLSFHNMGDGTNSHPSQIFQDLLTIIIKRGSLEGMRIGIFGDLYHSRVAHDLLGALSLVTVECDIEIVLVSPAETRLQDQYKKMFQKRRIKESDSMGALIGCDVVVGIRFQEERFENVPLTLDRIKKIYLLDKPLLNGIGDCVVLHSQPHNGQIHPSILYDPRVVKELEVFMGVVARTYLLRETNKNRQEKDILKTLPEGELRSVIHVPIKDYWKKRKKKGKRNHRYFRPIKRGTVIDHIPPGLGLKIRRILSSDNLTEGNKGTIQTIEAMLAENQNAAKDVIILEDNFLHEPVMKAVLSFAPMATFNVIKERTFTKLKISKPSLISGIGKCPNKYCISNHDIECGAEFFSADEGVLCYYCDKQFSREEIFY